MPKPDPQGGLVIEYDYLWRSEERKGREEGSKERPCAVVVAVPSSENGSPRAIVCGITHSKPEPPSDGIELSARVKAHLGLDEERSWVITSEVNVVDWDDPGITLTPTGAWSYGYLPSALAEKIRDKVLTRHKEGRLPLVDRPRIEARRAKREE